MPRLEPPLMIPSTPGELIVGGEDNGPERLSAGEPGSIMVVDDIGKLSWSIANLANFSSVSDLALLLDGYITQSELDSILLVEHNPDGTFRYAVRSDGPELTDIWVAINDRITESNLTPLELRLEALESLGGKVTISVSPPPGPSVGDLWMTATEGQVYDLKVMQDQIDALALRVLALE